MLNDVSYQSVELNINEEIFKIKLKWYQKVYYFIKCCIDILIAFIALLILLPIFIIIAVVIKIDSKGPVFFVYDRVGKNGKDFKCIKFRSMSITAKPDSASCDFIETTQITKVGKFLRKTSIDELPQLINVLCGEMNLIGYRPVLRNEKELNELRHLYNIYQLKPGITGWAQVNGRDLLGANPEKKAQLDAEYVKKLSLWFDIKVFFKTIDVVLKKDGNIDGQIKK